MANKEPEQRDEIGRVGWGSNLLLNMADHGFWVAGYVNEFAKVQALAP